LPCTTSGLEIEKADSRMDECDSGV